MLSYYKKIKNNYRKIIKKSHKYYKINKIELKIIKKLSKINNKQ